MTSIRFLGTAQNDKDTVLYFAYEKSSHHYFKLITSKDGFHFDGATKYVIVVDEKKREEKKYDWKNIRVSKQDSKFLILYQSNSKTPELNTAESPDLIHWTKKGKSENIKEVGAIVPNYKHDKKYVMYLGEKDIKIAYSTDLKKWSIHEEAVVHPRKDFFDHSDLEVASILHAHDNILLVYYVKNKAGKSFHYSAVGACLMDSDNPSKVLWRSEIPIWRPKDHFPEDHIRPLGVSSTHDELILYWLVRENEMFAVSCPLPGKYIGISNKDFTVHLKRHEKNPIIAPRPTHPWESRATFNSAAIYDDGKVHFFYRALGDTDLSVLGYANSKDGLHIDERSDMPAYIPREPFETPGGNAFKTLAEHFVSGGGYGGVEDPRITRVGDRVYLTYVAFDGATPPRAAMSSISIDDFRGKKWDRWETPKLISAPGMVNKSAVVFPEKINGKYVVMHRVYPNILIDYLDDLNFDKYLQGHYFIPPRKGYWDSKKIGAGAPPMRTKDGWLLIYQSVGYQDPGRYKIGAMMLDINNPSKVLYRTRKPLIAPDMEYENAGHKAGVVYPCGAAIVGDKLNVYYGGADTVVCGASQHLPTFLEQMKYDQDPKLKRIHGPVIN